MTQPFQDRSDDSKQAEKSGEDLTGRDRLISNVLSSWGAHFVFVVSGFIIPRMIDLRLGQELLGIWDFCWSLVAYFQIVQFGLTSSINRYVARCRAVGDIPGLNRVVSSGSCVLAIDGLLILAISIAASLLLPRLSGARLGENVLEAQWVVFFLGAASAVSVSFGAFRGVLTGSHHWGLHNIIRSGCQIGTVSGMILALLLGGSLTSLAVITFVGLALENIGREMIAHRVCKDLKLSPSMVKWGTIKKLYLFSGKTLIPNVSNLLLNQTASILIIAYLGPASLALFSRPRSLLLHVYKFVHMMALTLTPASSSLQSVGNLKGIRDLLIKSVRYSFYMVLPVVIVLAVFGGPILQLWMGPRYANGMLMAIFAIGQIVIIAQRPILNILIGLNAHGRAGMAQFVASLCSAGLTFLILGPLDLGLAGAAVAVTLPLTIMNLIYLPQLMCSRVGLSTAEYFMSAMLKPLVNVLPFALFLVCSRLLFHENHLYGAVFALVSGAIFLSVLYWRIVLPERMKLIIVRVFILRYQLLFSVKKRGDV